MADHHDIMIEETHTFTSLALLRMNTWPNGYLGSVS